MKYKYIGRCALGFVQFTRNDETVNMPISEAVEVPEWLAAKLKNNNHFEQVDGEDSQTEEQVSEDAPRRRGRPPKVQPDAQTEAE